MNREEKELAGHMNENDPKPYSKPQVTVHGKLEDLTQALAAGSKDGLSGSTVI